ncbi:serine/threonine-protein kinase [Vitiosangium sp. GDMCC 1.1324]|uniref:serine/threonine-protein kinase n=1 Tax=Vitiosangium sp. (strain GDMCC 1.1324) TaxID=2138576 RepID=UPI000D390A7F|nr:serine/threonine-protein kinase [Vitiosangium sp. GDMCC 1.1324]PTL78181.1 serine/threonine protein kinase [Vitiosangium sp. GDMCC 1.1324]
MTQPAASDIRVGAVLRDTYEITSLLGKGGMGAVFLARHRRLPGKQVAVKVLLNSASLNPELYARFRREAEIASQLGHPNIVEVLDFDTLQDGTPFLVMEYLRGESLEQRLSRGPLPLDAALSLTRQIGSALQAAHRAGVVHRDLKPANVFLVPTDSGGVVGERVKLLDFGISKMLDSQTLQTQDAVLIGTPQYMAPEQALGKNSEVDARTDLFALGCIVYEMLSGRTPFAGEGGSIVQVVFRIVHTQPEPLASLCPDLPGAIVSAVERALAKTPQDRYPDVASFIAELTGRPLQSLSGAPVPSFSSSRVASVPAAAADADGFAATHMPSSTARFPAPAQEGGGGAASVPSSTARFAAPADAEGFAATHMPSSTARFPAPADEGALGATHVPSSMARFPAPAAAATDEVGFAATLMPVSTAISQAQPAPVPSTAISQAQPAPAPLSAEARPQPVPSTPAVAPVAPQQAASARMGTGARVGAAVLVLGLVAAGWWFGARSAPAPVAVPTPTPSVTPPPVAPVEVKAPAVSAPTPAPPPAVAPAPVVEAPPTPTAPAVPEKTPTPSTLSKPLRQVATEDIKEDIKEEARSFLADAERALASGDIGAALRLARSSQQVQITSASYSVLTRAYCRQGDVGNAKGKWREGQKTMSSKDRGRVRQYCKQYEIEF